MEKQTIFLASNLKLLRDRKKKTQGDVAASLKVTRAKINAFENGVNVNPKIEDLAKFTAYFKVSVDSLLWVNLKRLTELQLRNLEAGNDEYIMGTKIRVLATTVDSKNRENIEIVSLKAKAGYTQGYSNPEFIGSLQCFHLPVLSPNRKFRMFQIEGDSMLPIPDKSYVISEFVENWNTIKNGQACIVLTKDEGIVFKEVSNNLKQEGTLLMHSLNPLFKDYSIKASEINEVWKFVSYLSSQIPESGITLEHLGTMLLDIKAEISKGRK
ncbi:MAG: LexA family transcriptional regulator [Bacteroidetes bacterium]|nr:LexA family transcriptional regulator [Bacteroidota bacterium]HET6244537.1 LexA family transcriptional regulator [Bacteroidia bacterium]